MRVLAWALVGIIGGASLRAQVPATDIFLAPLSMQDGRPIVGTPVNITSRAGYDNQPSFTLDGAAILFASTREDGQTDIYRYDLATKATTRVTSTPESEYSPAVMPGGTRFSVIRVERDSTQRLWSFALDGSDPRVVLPTLKPVGYYVWLSPGTLATFVLGSPNALVYVDLRTGKMDTLARGIGRSLAKAPRTGFSFTQPVDSVQRVRTLTGPGARPTDIVSLPRRVQDLVWLPNGSLLVGSGSKLLTWKSGAISWTDVADFTAAGLRDITRLAVSPDGKWLAIVALPPS